MPQNLGNTNSATEIYTANEINSLVSSERTAIGTASGTNNYSLTLTPALTSYAFGQVFDVLFTNANSGQCTLNVNGLGAVAIKKNGSIALKEGDILAGQVFSLFYDGTNFQLIGRISTNWKPPRISIGDTLDNGAISALNSGAGYYTNFDSGVDNEIVFNISLNNEDNEYDGSTIFFNLFWMKFGATGGNILIEIDYAFSDLGDDIFTKIDGTLTQTIDVTSIANQQLQSEKSVSLSASGAVGSKILTVTIRRAGTSLIDTFTGAFELYELNIEK